MKLDVTLRALSARGAPALAKLVSGGEVLEPLPTEFPETQDQRVDCLLRLKGGRILHIEWQAGFDATMPRRMLRYWVTITTCYPGTPVDQVVIQVGGDRLIKDRLDEGPVSFRYRVLDSRDIDAAPLLASPAIEDTILAILFGGGDMTSRIRTILQRIAALPPEQRADAITKLLVLSGARGTTRLIMEESRTMPLIIDTDQDPYLAALVDKGIRQGTSEALTSTLSRLLEKRFGPLPDERRKAIAQADIADLELWLDRIIDAERLDEVFAARPVN